MTIEQRFIENIRSIVAIGSKSIQNAADQRARVLAGSDSGDSTGAYMVRAKGRKAIQ
jgi:hypothetical protein